MDCDDGNAAVHPGAEERCDAAGTDEDCDGRVDDADPDVTHRTTWYRDADADGYGDFGDPTRPGGGTAAIEGCTQPTGFVSATGDCDDADPTRHPGRSEVCDPEDVDENCSSGADDDDPSTVDLIRWYRDDDGDGAGDPNSVLDSCDAPDGYTSSAGDCDDLDYTSYPGAVDVCGNAVDEDCDGFSDQEGCYETPTGRVEDQPGVARIDGTDEVAFIGVRVAALGDRDGDGDGEFAVAYHQAMVFSGPLPALRAASDADALLSGSWADLAAMDADGDGRRDLFLSDYAEGSVRILTSDLGDEPDTLITGFGGGRMTGGDVDGDGNVDLIVTEGEEGIRVLPGPYPSGVIDGTSARGTSPLGVTPDVLASGDLDGDGRAEVAYADSFYGFVEVLDLTAMAGVGSWHASWFISALVIADQDGDGYGDIIAGGAGPDPNGTVSIMRGPIGADESLGDPALRIEGIEDAGCGQSLAWVEPDLVIACPGIDAVFRGSFPQTGTVSLAEQRLEGSPDVFGVDVATAGDVDGDGVEDLLVGGYGRANPFGTVWIVPG